MGFAQEMRDFHKAWESQSRIFLNEANTRLVQSKTPNPADEANAYSTFDNPQTSSGGVGTTTAPQTSAGAGAGGAGGSGYKPTDKDIAAWTDYIGTGAAKRGMDPDVAIKVARSEGLAPGIWQSNLDYKGQREPSYGPFQMFTGGGLGNAFQKDTGLDPADPKNVLQTIDYALDHAKQNGWGAWHGWKGDEWAGINRSGRSDASPYTYTPTGEVPVADAGVDRTRTSGIPDEEDSGTESAAEGGDDVEQAAADPAQIDVPEAAPPQLTNPVVQLDQWGTGLFAAGGAIPDDLSGNTTMTNTSSKNIADIYGASRAMHRQATPQRQGSSFATTSRAAVPATTGQPVGTGAAAAPAWRSWGAAGSPSQQTFRNRAPAAAPAAAAAPAPVDNSGALQELYNERGKYLAQKRNNTGSQNVGMQRSQIRKYDTLLSDVDRRIAALGGNTQYARGGTVPDFNEWKRRETRMSGRAEEAGQGARDQAARRMNMRERGIDSTAYKDPSTKFPARPSPFKTPPPSGGGGGGGRPQASAGAQPGPAPDYLLNPAYEPGDTGPRPAPRAADPPAGPDRGAPGIRDPNDRGAPGIRDPNDRGAPGDPLITIPGFSEAETPPQEQGPPAPTTGDYVPEWNRNFARGGAIPDDDRRPVMQSQRAESSNLGPKKAKARARTDPWEGLRTKESKPVRKPTKQGGRNAGKRAKPKQDGKPKTPRADAAGIPTPTPRPDPTTGQESPLRQPSTGVTQPSPPQRQPAGTHTRGYDPLRQPAGTPSLPYDQRGQITETGNRGAPGAVMDASLNRGEPSIARPSTLPGSTSRSPAPRVATMGTLPQGQAVRQLPNAVPRGRPAAGTPTAGGGPPPTVPGYKQGQGQDRGILHAGMSTIADLLDMLSPEDYARPVEDLQQLNIQSPVASGGGPGFRRGGAIPDDGR